MSFDDFWNEYPKKTGIGAARRQWTNEVMFKAAIPDVITKSAMAFAHKHRDTDERYIMKPERFLSDQVYLDPDLQNFEKPEPLTGWKANFAKQLGEDKARIYLKDAAFKGGVLALKLAPSVVDLFKNNHETELNILGVNRVIADGFQR